MPFSLPDGGPVRVRTSNTASETPTPAELEEGEVALNAADGVLYFQGTSGAVGPVGFQDAPANGVIYGRRDLAWVDMTQGASLQLRRGTAAERAEITPLQGEPIYTTDTKRLYIGDGSTVGGNEASSEFEAPRLNPPDMIRVLTVRSVATFSCVVRSSSGYAAARWWDGSVDIYGTGAGTDITVSKSIPASGAWSSSSPKELFIWAAEDDVTAGKDGFISYFKSNSNQIASLNDGPGSTLATLDLASNDLTSISIGGGLSYLDVSNNQLTAAALNTLYRALQDRSDTSSGTIKVSGTIGAAASDTLIATAKNWVFE
jgi:hypothetical protein